MTSTTHDIAAMYNPAKTSYGISNTAKIISPMQMEWKMRASNEYSSRLPIKKSHASPIFLKNERLVAVLTSDMVDRYSFYYALSNENQYEYADVEVAKQ